MTVEEAVQARQAVRAFLPDPVDAETVATLLRLASQAPSGGNLQPWHVFILAGPARDALVAAVLAKLERGERETPAYDIYPRKLWEPLRARRQAAGLQRYAALGLARGPDSQLALERENLRFFGAPVGLFFCLDRRVGPPQWSDVGMFMQTFMLLAVARGLATCPQEVWATWPDSVGAALDLPEHLMLFSGMSLGHPDTRSAMNAYRTAREPLETFATFIGFPVPLGGRKI